MVSVSGNKAADITMNKMKKVKIVVVFKPSKGFTVTIKRVGAR